VSRFSRERWLVQVESANVRLNASSQDIQMAVDVGDTGLPDELSRSVVALLDRAKASRWGVAKFVVGDSLARHFIVVPPRNASRLADLRALAAVRFANLFGEEAERWTIVAHWDATHPFLCAAVPTCVLEQLKAASKSVRCQIADTTTRLVHDLDELRRRIADPEAWLLCPATEGPRSHLLVCAHGRPSRLTSALLAPDADDMMAWRTVEHAALRWQLDAPAQVLRIAGDRRTLRFLSPSAATLVSPEAEAS
jgi:hypothetical protein